MGTSSPNGQPDFEVAARACLGGGPGVGYGIVLGSGLAVLDDLEERHDVAYREIPGFPQPTVEGHKGILSLGRVPGGARVAIARGRFHLYEGHELAASTYLVRMFRALGAHSVILTNAAGGLHGDWTPGDLMLMSDHLNLTGGFMLAPHLVPADRHVYDMEWQAEVLAAAASAGVAMRRGCYVGLLGPSYETAAEIRFMLRAGADAVGMSTVLEASAAIDAGMRVLGISCITNIAVTNKGLAETSHAEVVDVAGKASSRLDRLLRAVCLET
ncbi:MAG: purine-nucleoside phosphorylase [Candidatus Sericytochromatia bacterium]|nr:purine-nucleoside phosphorylase [Candidatus Tanganyikabacteria bacterium]